MKRLQPISGLLRKAAREIEAEVRSPSPQYVYYQDADEGYGTRVEDGAGSHMNTPNGHEFADTNHLLDESNYEDDIENPVMTIRPGDRDQYAPDTTFHTQVYAASEAEKVSAAPWGEEYAKPRDGGLGTYFEPATKPEGCGQDCGDLEEGQQPRSHGAPHDYGSGEQDNRYLFFDRTVYPSIPSVV